MRKSRLTCLAQTTLVLLLGIPVTHAMVEAPAQDNTSESSLVAPPPSNIEKIMLDQKNMKIGQYQEQMIAKAARTKKEENLLSLRAIGASKTPAAGAKGAAQAAGTPLTPLTPLATLATLHVQKEASFPWVEVLYGLTAVLILVLLGHKLYWHRRIMHGGKPGPSSFARSKEPLHPLRKAPAKK